MSTRSGKRIHSSLNVDAEQPELDHAVKSERKTRGKRLKENCEDSVSHIPKVKKRHNYVAYPTDDEQAPEKDLPEVKSGKRTRRNTLKEQNTNLPIPQTITMEEKPSRLTRQTRKVAENPDIIPQEATAVPEKKKSKKNKKKKAKLSGTNEAENSEKPSKKLKKKKSGSINRELNKSNVSTDSFHSAAGSPINTENKKPNSQELSSTFEKEEIITETQRRSMRKSSVINSSINKTEFKKSSQNVNEDELNTRHSGGGKATENIIHEPMTGEPKARRSVRCNGSDNTIPDTTDILNSTYDKNDISSKSSLITSDSTVNLTFDKDNSRISITSDDSKTDNIINTTPVLIESSMDESRHSKISKTPDNLIVPTITPLKREGTFTKDGPDVIILSPRPKLSTTPTVRQSLASPGFTPFHGRGSQKEKKSVLNVTRSIEKPACRSTLSEVQLHRQTRVMFCSPVNDPNVLTQQKKKVIKSSMKGSSKSFVFDDSASLQPGRRKRSLTAGDEASRAKRSRLSNELQMSVDRLSRPKEPKTTAPAPRHTPAKTKAELKRTKLPNFAALHQKEFNKMESLDETRRARLLLTPTAGINDYATAALTIPLMMESLDECQERKARRARLLLTPKGGTSKGSPKDTTEKKPKEKETRKPEASKPSTTLPTLESLRPGYSRFGFKMDYDVNPFSVTKTPKDTKTVKKSMNTFSETKPMNSFSEMKPKTNGVLRDKSLPFTRASKRIAKPVTEVKPSKLPNGLKDKSIIEPFTRANIKKPINFVKPLIKINGIALEPLKRQLSQPSLNGTTNSRKDIAKQAVMREKSNMSSRVNVCRNENRSIIKGVRTNRRFELQMKMRNVD